MIFTPAFLVSDYTPEEKLQLQTVGAKYDVGKGYFITEDQRQQMEMYSKMQGMIIVDDAAPARTSPIRSSKKSESIAIVDDVSRWLLVGNTYNLKDKIKEIGGRWDAGRKGWYFTKEKMPNKEEILQKMDI